MKHPAAARTHMGMYATAQSYESLLLRMRAHPLHEVRAYGDAMLAELRKVIPAFLTRVDREDRGGAWSRYLQETRERTESVAKSLPHERPEPRPEVVLTDFDPGGEYKVVAAALYAASDLPDGVLQVRGRGRRRDRTATRRARRRGYGSGRRCPRSRSPGRRRCASPARAGRAARPPRRPAA